MPVSLSASDDADRGERHREHDDERIAQRLVLRRHDGVDEQDGEDQHDLQLVERARLLLDFGAEPDREVRRHRERSGSRALTAATASLSVTSGSAVTRTMRSWFLRWISVGPDWLRSASRFFAWSTWPCGVLIRMSLMSSTRSPVLLAEAHDDRVLVAALAEERGLRAADVRADAVGDVGHRQAEQRRPSADRPGCASSGRPSSRPTRALRTSGTLSISAFALERRAAWPRRGRRRGFRARAGCRRRRAAGSSADCRRRPASG